MGIPSYFSYILKKHSNIIGRLNQHMNNLYLDSNSIIYDSLRLLEGNHNFEHRLIQSICKKIDEYISIINPDCTIIYCI